VIDDEGRTSPQQSKLKNSGNGENNSVSGLSLCRIFIQYLRQSESACGSSLGRLKKGDLDKAAKVQGFESRPVQMSSSFLLQEKEKQERKVAKAEKERKAQDAQNKSRSIMANFFAKSKSARASPSSESNVPTGPIQSEFEKTFKTFALKKDANLAPINWFSGKKRKKLAGFKEREVIIIDEDEDEDVQMKDTTGMQVNVSWMNAEGLAFLPPHIFQY
jgi:hypothetical protein